jgi:hypothetical protein
MKLVWLRENWATWRVHRLPLLVLSLIERMQRDGLHIHRAEASYQEGCREPLPVNFAVELVGRLVNAQLFQHPRKLFVPDAAPHHLFLYQPLRFFFPRPIVLGRQPTPVRRFFHHFPSLDFTHVPILAPLEFSHSDFRSYTTDIEPGSLHVLSNLFFCEDRMLTKSLQTDVSTSRVAAASGTTSQTQGRLQTLNGGAK